MELTELILYAIPTGPLAQTVDRFYAALAARPTIAQSFPPHCTLTGFFHDVAAAISAYADAAAASIRPVAVAVSPLRAHPDWIGLELQSADLEVLAADFAERVDDISTRVDDVRCKDWLHLSLAYGFDPADRQALGALAGELVDATLEVGWELRVYERSGTSWIVHGGWPLPSR